MSKTKYHELRLKTRMSNTQAAGLFEVDVTSSRRWGAGTHPTPHAVILCLESIASGAPVNAGTFAFPNKLVDAVNTLAWAIRHDPSYAYRWHCNIAGAIIDSEVSYLQANEAAARFMYTAFKVDTITGAEPFLGTKRGEHEDDIGDKKS